MDVESLKILSIITIIKVCSLMAKRTAKEYKKLVMNTMKGIFKQEKEMV